MQRQTGNWVVATSGERLRTLGVSAFAYRGVVCTVVWLTGGCCDVTLTGPGDPNEPNSSKILACGTADLCAEVSPDCAYLSGWDVSPPAPLTVNGRCAIFHAPNVPGPYTVSAECDCGGSCSCGPGASSVTLTVCGVTGMGNSSYPIDEWPQDSPDNDPCSWAQTKLMPVEPNGVYITMTVYYNDIWWRSWLSVTGGEAPLNPDHFNQRRVKAWVPASTTVTGTMGCTWRSTTLKVVTLVPPLSVSGAQASPVEPNDANDPNQYQWYFAPWDDDPNQHVVIAATLNPECSPNEAKVVLGWGGATPDPNNYLDAWVSKGYPGSSKVSATCSIQAGVRIGIVKLTGLGVAGIGNCANELITGVGSPNEYITFTASIDPYVAPGDLPGGFVQWSGGEQWNDQLHRRVRKWEPTDTTVRCTIGDSNYAERVKVVRLEDVEVTGGDGSWVTDPDNNPLYLAAWSETGHVDIRASLNPDCNDAEARCVLGWFPTLDPDPDEPNNWQRRSVPLNTPGLYTVTGMVGTSQKTVRILVVKATSLTLGGADPNYSCGSHTVSQDGTGDANDLYVGERDEGYGEVALSAVFGPTSPSYAAGYVAWTVDGQLAEPNHGNMSGGQTTVRLSPWQGNRTFKFTLGVDTNGDGRPDAGKLELSVHVVRTDIRVDSNNDGAIGDSDDPIEANAPGKIVPLNNDHDDGEPNVPDRLMTSGPYNDEDDLVPADLRVEGGAAGQGQWQLSAPGGQIRVYREQNKTGQVTLNDWRPIAQMPSRVYVEGIGRGGEAGNVHLALHYQVPDCQASGFTDEAVVTVATVEFAKVTLPNGFLGTLDEDVQRLDWDAGIRQSAENRIKLEYRLTPEVPWSCNQSEIRLVYNGRFWFYVGQPAIEDAYGVLCTQGGLPGAPGDANATAYPDLNIAPGFDGFCPTGSGGHYKLILKSSGGGLEFTSDPQEVTAKPLVYGFCPDPEVFCPYTTQSLCPHDQSLGLPEEAYWGARLTYGLNGDLEGHDAVGTVDAIVLGDYAGLEVEIQDMKLLRVVRGQKRLGAQRYAKWEGYDATVSEPGGEPVYWGPGDPQREKSSNAADYPALLFVPGHVVAETSDGTPYRVAVRATADMADFPGCLQVYRRWNVPVWVEYDMDNP
jgi:hypothetical protein